MWKIEKGSRVSVLGCLQVRGNLKRVSCGRFCQDVFPDNSLRGGNMCRRKGCANVVIRMVRRRGRSKVPEMLQRALASSLDGLSRIMSHSGFYLVSPVDCTKGEHGDRCTQRLCTLTVSVSKVRARSGLSVFFERVRGGRFFTSKNIC